MHAVSGDPIWRRALPLAAFAVIAAGVSNPVAASEPRVSLTGGGAWHAPTHAPGVEGAPGWRVGLAFPTTLPAGSWAIPVEWGLSVRSAALRFGDAFEEASFLDLQAPALFHGDLFGWKHLEPLALWIPSWTLDMTTSRRGGGSLSNTDALQTRFNMGFGAGLQGVHRGFRLRVYVTRYIFPPFTGADLVVTDWTAEVAVPLWRGR